MSLIFPDGYTRLTPIVGTEKIMAARLSDGKMFWINLSDVTVGFATTSNLTAALIPLTGLSTVQTVNLHNPATDVLGGLTTQGNEATSTTGTRSGWIPVTANTPYSFWDGKFAVTPKSTILWYYYTSAKVFIAASANLATSPATAAYMRVFINTLPATNTLLMLVAGATAPAKFYRFGYNLNLSDPAAPLVVTKETIADALLDSGDNILTALQTTKKGIYPVQLNFTTRGINKFNAYAADVLPGTGIVATTGVAFTSSGNALNTASGFVDITAGNSYLFTSSIDGILASILTNGIVASAWYDKNYVFLSAPAFTSGITVAPAGAVYLRFSVATTSLYITMLIEGTAAPVRFVKFHHKINVAEVNNPLVLEKETIADALVASGDNVLAALNTRTKGILPGMASFIKVGQNKFNYFDPGVMAGTGLITTGVAAGNTVSNTGNAPNTTTAFTPVDAGASYLFTTQANLTTASPSKAANITAVWYDVDKNFIGIATYTSGITISPSNAAYIRWQYVSTIIIYMQLIQSTAVPAAYQAWRYEFDTSKVIIPASSSGGSTTGGVSPFVGTIADYGCAADAILCLNGSCTAGSDTLTVTDAFFTAADINKTIAIPYAAADNGTQVIGATHVATILQVLSATSVQLSAAVIKTIVGQRTVADCAMTLDSNVLTSATANFTTGDIGKKLIVMGAGEQVSNTSVNTAFHIVYITSVTSATTVTVTNPALQTISGKTLVIPGAWVQYGTDDTVKLQAAFDGAAAAGKRLHVQRGRYLTTANLIPTHNLTIEGVSRIGTSIISPVGSGFSLIRNSTATANVPLLNFSISNMELDCFGVTASSYGTINKAIYCVNMQNPKFSNLYIHESSATGLGCDFLRDYDISNVITDHCGRQVFEFGSGAGGSGIGIGTGTYTTEAGSIFNCYNYRSGKQGIFLESQSSNILSMGAKITHCTSMFCGNAGFGDRATRGTVWAFNTAKFNLAHGMECDLGFVNGLYSEDFMFYENVCYGNYSRQIYIKFLGGNGTVANNNLNGQTTRGKSAGLEIALIAGGTPGKLTIKNNQINKNANRGILISGSQYNLIEISGNYNADNTGVGIVLAANANRVYLRDNIALDTRAVGAKTQTTGFQLSGAITVGKLVNTGNDFTENATAEYDYGTATITTNVTRNNP